MTTNDILGLISDLDTQFTVKLYTNEHGDYLINVSYGGKYYLKTLMERTLSIQGSQIDITAEANLRYYVASSILNLSIDNWPYASALENQKDTIVANFDGWLIINSPAATVDDPVVSDTIKIWATADLRLWASASGKLWTQKIGS